MPKHLQVIKAQSSCFAICQNKVNIGILKLASNQQGGLEDWGTVSPGEGEVVRVNVGDKGIGIPLVHMRARANRGQTSPNFPM